MAEHPKLPSAMVGVVFPATRAQLVTRATELHADAETMAVLNAIPDQSYPNADAVIAAARQLP